MSYPRVGVSRLENIIESYIFNHRTLLSRIDCATCLHYNYYRRAILSSLDAHNSNPRGISFELFRALENLLSVGESFVVRIMRLRVKKSVAQRVVRRQCAAHSGSRQIGSTSKTILAENCSTNPYIKCPGYRARSREQGQPRP